MEYDVAVNTVKVNIHLASDYAFANGALQRLTVSHCRKCL